MYVARCKCVSDELIKATIIEYIVNTAS